MSLLGQDNRGMVKCTEILPPMIDLGPLFVDKDAGRDAPDRADKRPKKDDSYSLKVGPDRLQAAWEQLRGYWAPGGRSARD